jgi:hypothetical protein
MTARALAAALAVAAATAAGCGDGGSAKGGDDAARATVTRYFAALGQGRSDAACRELSEPSQEKLAEYGSDVLRLERRSCPATMQRLLSSPAGPRLRALGRDARITSTGHEAGKVAVRVAGVAKPIEVRSADGSWRIESTPSVEPDKLPGGREGGAEHGGDGG